MTKEEIDRHLKEFALQKGHSDMAKLLAARFGGEPDSYIPYLSFFALDAAVVTMKATLLALVTKSLPLTHKTVKDFPGDTLDLLLTLVDLTRKSDNLAEIAQAAEELIPKSEWPDEIEVPGMEG